MKTVVLELEHIHTPEALQIYLQYRLGFPAYYGRKLDALYDMLSEMTEQTHIVLRLPAKPTKAMEAYLPKLLHVFEDAANENQQLTMETCLLCREAI